METPSRPEIPTDASDGRAVPGRWDPWYLTGLIEALGTFTFSRSGRNLSVYLAMKVPSADAELLERFRGELGGVGRIYSVRSRSLQQTSSSSANPDSASVRPTSGTCYYRICRQADLMAVLDHLERYPLQGRKRVAFELWKRMVELKASYRHPARDDLADLAARLSGERLRRAPVRRATARPSPTSAADRPPDLRIPVGQLRAPRPTDETDH